MAMTAGLIGGRGGMRQSIARCNPLSIQCVFRLSTYWRTRITSVAVASGLVMEFVDATALATALPTMAEYFAVRPEALKMALTTYVLALAVFMPVSTWLSDRFGPKRVYLGALLVFTFGSLACALSTTLPTLIAARAFQGMGGALMTPVARTIILRATPRAELVSAMNWFTMPAQLGPLLGPPVAGLILAVADWRWIFLINLPIAALGALAVARYVPSESGGEVRDFDFGGYLLAAAAITLFVGSSEVASMHSWSGSLLVAVLGAVVTGTLYVRHALRSAHPVLDVRLFGDLTFRTSMLGGTLSRIAVGATPLLLPLLLQIGLGWTPLQAGLVMMGQALGTLAAKAVATNMLERFSFRTMLIASSLTAACINVVPATFDVATPMWLAFLLMVGTGVARSSQFTMNNTVSFADLRSHQLAGASTMQSVVQQVGHALGISIGGLLLASQATHGEALRVADFTVPFIVVGLLAASASIFYAQLHANTGAHMRGVSR
jgi:EmrB/QacA subfamily drug resistance transporter